MFARPRRMRLAPLVLLLVPALALRAFAEDPPAEKDPDQTPTRLVFEGTAAFEKLGSLGQENFNLRLSVSNPTGSPLEIRRGNLLLCHPGGWLVPLDPDSLDGSYFRGVLAVQSKEQRAVGGSSYRAITPASHALLSVSAEDGHADVPIPIVRKGYAAPGPCHRPQGFGVGFVGPLHVLPYSDGKSSVLLIGQHQVLRGQTPDGVRTTISLGSDKGSTDPLAWKGLDAEGDRSGLWPFVRRIDVFEGFEGGRLRITSSAVVEGRKASYSGSWPVERLEPLSVRAPVLGTWQMSNGPGQREMSDHYANPQYRYAYDLLVLKQGRTHRGDPHRNESYFAWNRSIRAVADGEVVYVCDHERDNPGYRGASTKCYNNHVVIKHKGGYYTAYLHIRQRSVAQGVIVESKVRAGQVIARVGNSGESSEPHLHFMAFRIDKTGRLRSVPVTFTNAWHDAQGARPVRGVPLGGHVYHFRDKK